MHAFGVTACLMSSMPRAKVALPFASSRRTCASSCSRLAMRAASASGEGESAFEVRAIFAEGQGNSQEMAGWGGVATPFGNTGWQPPFGSPTSTTRSWSTRTWTSFAVQRIACALTRAVATEAAHALAFVADRVCIFFFGWSLVLFPASALCRHDGVSRPVRNLWSRLRPFGRVVGSFCEAVHRMCRKQRHTCLFERFRERLCTQPQGST